MEQPVFIPIDRLEESLIRFAVVAARYQDKWIFCRHKLRQTWEMPGGHREIGETPLEAARRELYEETGAKDADIQIVGAYKFRDHGLLAFAEVKNLAEIPENSEIAEIGFFETLPSDLTYPGVHDQLHNWVQNWRNMQNGAGELWDVYDENRNFTGRFHRRGTYLPDGDYHLVVHVWICNSKGQFLLTKRSPNKGFPNMWECTGGSALAGDDSLSAALREVREEMGLELQPDSGKCVISFRREDAFVDIWLFHQDFDLTDVRLLKGETCDVMYASVEQIRQLHEQGKLVPFSYLDAMMQIAEG